MRVAVLGQGAIGTLVADALAPRATVVRVDRTGAPPPAGVVPVDAAIVCVKTPGTPWAVGVAQRILAPQGVALTLQNGLGNLEALAAALGEQRAAAGSVYSGAYRTDRGVVATGPLRLTLARGDAPAAVDAIAALLRSSGAEVTVVDAPGPLLWRKAVVSAALNPVSAIVGVTNGELVTHAAGVLVADALAREASRVASALGAPVGEDEAVALWRSTARASAANRSSMLEDVRAGRETEIDAICGEIARRGARAGRPAPLSAAMAACVAALAPVPAV